MFKGLKKFTGMLTLVAVAGLSLTATTNAQDNVPIGGEGDYNMEATSSGAQWFPDDGRLGPFSVSAGVDLVTQYFFRGYEIEDSGGIFQPWLEVGLVIYENEDGPINGVDVYVGSWNSIHTEGDTLGSTSNWFETDIYTGFNVAFLDYFTFGFVFTDYEYPGLGDVAIREIGLSLSFDDSSFWEGVLPLKGFAINPYAFYAIELQNIQANGNQISNAYFETGIAPGFDIPLSDDYAIGFSFPMYIGLSIDNYYVDSDGDGALFGYFAFGPQFAVPLSFIPSDFGDFEFTAGVTALCINAAGTTDGGGSLEVYGNFGLSWSY